MEIQSPPVPEAAVPQPRPAATSRSHVLAGRLPREAPGAAFPAPSSSAGPGAPWLVAASLRPLPPTPRGRPRRLSPLLSLLRTRAIGFMAHRDNPGRLRLRALTSSRWQ